RLTLAQRLRSSAKVVNVIPPAPSPIRRAEFRAEKGLKSFAYCNYSALPPLARREGCVATPDVLSSLSSPSVVRSLSSPYLASAELARRRRRRGLLSNRPPTARRPYRISAGAG